MKVKKVLFVCTGNTCRSPMAEALLRAQAGETIEVKSAGIYALPNSPMSEGTQTILTEKDIDFSHKAQTVTKELLAWADIVLTMTKAHKDAIHSLFPHSYKKLKTLKEFVDPNTNNLDIADPFGGSTSTYRKTAEQIERCLEDFPVKF